MLHIHTLVQAKKTARALEKALERKGVELQHGKALDALAAMCGFLDWNSYAKSVDPTVLDQQLNDFERSHMENCGDEDYGREEMLVAHTGFQLRFSAETEMCEYVRVCDPLGRELMYWHSDEWAEDPEVVVGAILGALVRGRPAPAPKVSRKTHAAQALPVPRVQDIDFHAAHAVVFGGRSHTIAWREDKVLAMLNSSAPDTLSQGEAEAALRLHYEDDGFVEEVVLSLGTLASMRWNADKNAFVDSEKQSYQFFFEVSASEWFARPGALKRSVDKAQPVAEAISEALALYQVQGAYADRKTGHEVPVDIRIAGFGQFDALARVRAMYDNALHELRVDAVAPTPESAAGPFNVYVDGGIYDTVSYLQQALDLAEVLVPTGTDEVTVEDKDHNVVWRLNATGEEA